MGAALGAKIPGAGTAGTGKSAVNRISAIPAMGNFPFTATALAGHSVSEQPFAANCPCPAITQTLIHHIFIFNISIYYYTFKKLQKG
jgi:hypothetical protein